MTGEGGGGEEGPVLRIFDDREADGWRPFALTRPVGELRFGALVQRERLELYARHPCREHLTRAWLSAFDEPGAPRASPRRVLEPGEGRLVLSSRWVPDTGARFERPEGPALIVSDGAPVGCWLPPGAPPLDPDWLERPEELEGAAGEIRVPGRVLSAPWELIEDGSSRIARDLETRAPASARVDPGALPEGVHAIGDASLFLETGTRIEAGVLFDLREGPIWLRRGGEVLSAARLAGPLFADRECRLLGGPISTLGAGPVSHLRGEISETTTLGWVNKAHAGHLGHAYLGRWVNLGAGTTNSDLKNNYGPIRIVGPEGPIETGLLKLGCLLGDHVKTAIGTLLGTGTVVGAGANLFGEDRPARWVPPFAWGIGSGRSRYRLEEFLETASVVMGRREVAFEEPTRRWLTDVWEEAARRAEARKSEAGPSDAGTAAQEASTPDTDAAP